MEDIIACNNDRIYQAIVRGYIVPLVFAKRKKVYFFVIRSKLRCYLPSRLASAKTIFFSKQSVLAGREVPAAARPRDEAHLASKPSVRAHGVASGDGPSVA